MSQKYRLFKHLEKNFKGYIIKLENGKWVNVGGPDGERVTRSTAKRVGKRIPYTSATQSDMKELMNNPQKYGDWSQIIEVVKGSSPSTSTSNDPESNTSEKGSSDEK